MASTKETMPKNKDHLDVKQDDPNAPSESSDSSLNKDGAPSKKEAPATTPNVDAQMAGTDPADPAAKKLLPNDGAGTIVPATQEQITKEKQHQASTKSVAPEDASKYVVTISKTSLVATNMILSDRNDGYNFPTLPLSATTFNIPKVEKDSSLKFGRFVVSPEPLKLVKLYSTKNQDQLVNPEEVTLYGDIDKLKYNLIRDSVAMFNSATQTVRVRQALDITDPNSTKPGVLEITGINATDRPNQQQDWVSNVENRLRALMEARDRCSNRLTSFIFKTATLSSFTREPESRLALQPVFEYMEPHIMYSVFGPSPPQWLRDELLALDNEDPVRIAEVPQNTSTTGAKLHSTLCTTIDQFSAAVAAINFEKLRNNQLGRHELHALLTACCLDTDTVTVGDSYREGSDVPSQDMDLTLLYRLSNEEYNVFMFRALVSSTFKQEILGTLMGLVDSTNLLVQSEFSKVWKRLTTTDSISLSLDRAFSQMAAVGDKQSPAQMLVFETFADWLDVQFNMSSIPDGVACVPEIFNLYAFIILFPRLAQTCINDIGYRLSCLFDSMLRNTYADFTGLFGEIREDYGRTKSTKNKYKMTKNESRSGDIYSIFADLPTKPRGKLGQFCDILSNIRTIVLPPADGLHLHLTRKSAAHLPYWYDNYTTYRSWQKRGGAGVSDFAFIDSPSTNLGRRLIQLFSQVKKLIELRKTESIGSSSEPKQFQEFFKTWDSHFTQIIDQGGLPFETTMSRLQETLFNCPFYFGDRFDPTTPKRYFYVPNQLVVGCADKSKINSNVPIKPVSVWKFNPGIVTNFLVTLDGQVLRPLVIPANSEGGGFARTDVTTFNGSYLATYAMESVYNSLSFGHAFQFAKWVMDPNDPNNPIRDFATIFVQVAAYSNWSKMVRFIFEYYKQDYSEIFSSYVNGRPFGLDGRYFDRVILERNSAGDPLPPRPGSRFGRELQLVDNYDLRILAILQKLFVNTSSPLYHIHRGWYLGKMTVDKIQPSQVYSSISHNWGRVIHHLDNGVKFTHIVLETGRAPVFTYTYNGQESHFILPGSTRNPKRPVLLKILNYSTIPHSHVSVVSEAVARGSLILYIEQCRVHVTVEDKPSLTLSYDDRDLTADNISEILYQGDGAIISRTFPSVRFATNLQQNALVRTIYTQWWVTEDFKERDLHAAVLTNSLTRPENTILPQARELGFGLDPDGTRALDGTLKIDGSYINWNNSIPVISTSLISSVGVSIVSRAPFALLRKDDV